MTNDIIKNKSKSLQELLPPVIDINQNTENAIVFYKLNKEGLKYLLTAYDYYGRGEVLLNHLEKEFGTIDKKAVSKLLNTDRIYTVDILKKRLYIYMPVLIVLIILLLAFLLKLPPIIILIFPAALIYIIVGMHFEDKWNTKYVNYKLSDVYKYQPIPDKIL